MKVGNFKLLLITFLLKVNLNGKEGFELSDELSEDLKNELAWGSQQILRATAASTILIYWDNRVILR